MTKKFSCWHRTLNQAYCIRHTSSKLIFGHFMDKHTHTVRSKWMKRKNPRFQSKSYNSFGKIHKNEKKFLTEINNWKW